MKLLLDENLSRRLVPAISALFPNSKHVLDCGLEGASDTVIWQYALDQGFAIVSKDSDFADRSGVMGDPPKVVWLKVANCKTSRAEFMLINLSSMIQDFLPRGEKSCLVLRHPKEHESRPLARSLLTIVSVEHKRSSARI